MWLTEIDVCTLKFYFMICVSGRKWWRTSTKPDSPVHVCSANYRHENSSTRLTGLQVHFRNDTKIVTHQRDFTDTLCCVTPPSCAEWGSCCSIKSVEKKHLRCTKLPIRLKLHLTAPRRTNEMFKQAYVLFPDQIIRAWLIRGFWDWYWYCF